MPNPGHMERRCQEMLGEGCDTAIPRLIKTLKTPYKVGMLFGVYSNAVRSWLLKHGYQYINGEWVNVLEAEHA